MNKNRILTAILALATAGTAILPAQQVIRHAPHHTCTAEIRPFEDGSWGGGPLRYDGRIIDPHWDRNMPAYGWLPGYRGTACTLVISTR
jgi:hypothetical protein